eukprot:scaffold57085_cov31-Tisochrysis_lutea.AAC.4
MAGESRKLMVGAGGARRVAVLLVLTNKIDHLLVFEVLPDPVAGDENEEIATSVAGPIGAQVPITHCRCRCDASVDIVKVAETTRHGKTGPKLAIGDITINARRLVAILGIRDSLPDGRARGDDARSLAGIARFVVERQAHGKQFSGLFINGAQHGATVTSTCNPKLVPVQQQGDCTGSGLRGVHTRASS